MPKSKKRKPNHKQKKQPRPHLPIKVLDRLKKAQRLIDDKDWVAAQKILAPLSKRYPKLLPIWEFLADIYYELNDTPGYQVACENLLSLKPKNPDYHLMLASVYATNAFPALAYQQFQHVVETWPHHENIENAKSAMAELQTFLNELPMYPGISQADKLVVLAGNDHVRSLMMQEHYAQARQLAQKLINDFPSYIPLLNNLAQLHQLEDNLPKALTVIETILTLEPHNIFAHSNKARFYLFAGQLDKAQQQAEYLKQMPLETLDEATKIVEALTFVGDNQGIIDIFEAIKKSATLNNLPEMALIHHLTAVAYLRLGHAKQAQQHWKRALQINPQIPFVQENLDDLKKPVSERHAPWAYGLTYWLSQAIVDDIAEQMSSVIAKDNANITNNIVMHLLAKYPQLTRLAASLLNQGDPFARQLIYFLAKESSNPTLLLALKAFALGQWGPDAMRDEAAKLCLAAGLLRHGEPIKLWLNGEWQEIRLLNFTITTEPQDAPSPTIALLLSKSSQAFNIGDYKQAEQLLNQAYQLAPDLPVVKNNLARVYIAQGRKAEAKAVITELSEMYPNYMLSKINMAKLLIETGDFNEAEAILQPIFEQKELHISDYVDMIGVYVELFLAKGDVNIAELWLDMLQQSNPSHHYVEKLQQKIDLFKQSNYTVAISGEPPIL